MRVDELAGDIQYERVPTLHLASVRSQLLHSKLSGSLYASAFTSATVIGSSIAQLSAPCNPGQNMGSTALGQFEWFQGQTNPRLRLCWRVDAVYPPASSPLFSSGLNCATGCVSRNAEPLTESPFQLKVEHPPGFSCYVGTILHGRVSSGGSALHKDCQHRCQRVWGHDANGVG